MFRALQGTMWASELLKAGYEGLLRGILGVETLNPWGHSGGCHDFRLWLTCISRKEGLQQNAAREVAVTTVVNLGFG